MLENEYYCVNIYKSLVLSSTVSACTGFSAVALAKVVAQDFIHLAFAFVLVLTSVRVWLTHAEIGSSSWIRNTMTITRGHVREALISGAVSKAAQHFPMPT